MKKFAFTLALVLGMFAMPRQASAASIQYVLDCTLTSATTCPIGGPFGSVILTDNGNNIDVVVNLTTGNTIENLNLNWVGVAPLTGWVASGGNIGANTITVSNNNTGPFARFDIRVADNGPWVSPLSFTLSNTLFGDLDTSFFNTRDDVNQTYVGVRSHGPTEQDSPAYGALTSNPIPEPTTLVMLGSGLLFAATRLRRRS